MSLTYRDKGTSGTLVEVVSNELSIGHLNKHPSGTKSHEKWDWNFSITPGPPGFEYNGRAETLEDAKAAVERNWRGWLKAAGLPDKDEAPP